MKLPTGPPIRFVLITAVLVLLAGAVATSPADGPDAALTPAGYFSGWVFLPPLVTIVLAIWLRQVVPALLIGTFVAAFMFAGYRGAAGLSTTPTILHGVELAAETFIVGALADADHAKIIIFTLTIGGMVGILGRSGATAAIVNLVARWAGTRRRGQLATWAAGLLVFFDDYANAMIVGPSVRPVCDRLRISREKLAYLVDSTAAPVASIALIGTWIGAEVGFIQQGLDGLSTPPDFLPDTLGEGAAYQLFLDSIVYRFYPLLALFMVFLIAALNRDFGPMRRAERELPRYDHGDEPAPAAAGRAWHAAVPIAVLIVGTLGLLVATGWYAAGDELAGRSLVAQLRTIVTAGDSYDSILYGALAAILAAAAIALGTRRLRLGDAVEGALESMQRMFPTMVVLVLAWSLSAAMQALELGQVGRDLLREAEFGPQWLPLLTFLAAAVVSFATGTSWGTMGILCPAVVTIAAGLLEGTPPDEAYPLFVSSVGAVLAGAVFGDHCSPISDTTVLSALASSCPLMAHVWTQLPYALTAATVAMLAGYVPLALGAWSVWLALGVGAGGLIAVILAIGRPPDPERPITPATGSSA